jgi:hypothetical protein
LGDAHGEPPHTPIDRDTFANHGVAEPATEYAIEQTNNSNEQSFKFLTELSEHFSKLPKSGQHAVLAALYREIEKANSK